MDCIKIHNFGPVKDVDIELSKLMVFIGPQGSGKSTIAKLLTVLSDVYWWIKVCENDNPLEEFRRIGIESCLQSDTIINYWRDEVHITFDKGSFSLSVKDVKPEDTRKYCKALIGNAAKKELEKLGAIDNIQGDRLLAKNRNYLRAYMRLACYIPAERNLTGAVASSLANILVSKVPLPNTLIEFMSFFERARNYYATYDASFLGVKYIRDFGNECISLLENSEKHLPLEACSSGIQSALPLLMVLDYAREDSGFESFVIEEPEQNLFPTNQREVLNRIVRLSQHKKDCTIIINTHSPYLLSALNVSLLAAELAKVNDYKEEVDSIVPPQFRVDSADVSVFSLGGENYCESIKDDKTGIVSVNYLDVVSDAIGSDFNKLYQLYLKTLKK
ncbi:MAG: AAA family ATPase [Bacteroidales bacterium]|nr:AAA family ATPase [Bacteroidales bacterium]